MEWETAQTVLAVAGALFLVGVVASLHPRVPLSLTSRVVLSAAAGAYVAGALAISHTGSVAYRSLVWLVLVAVLAVIARDLVETQRARRLGVTAPPVAEFSAKDPLVDVPSSGEEVSALARASDPSASAAELADLAYICPAARRLVASNPSTPASVLSWLAANGDATIADAIAQRHEIRDQAESAH